MNTPKRPLDGITVVEMAGIGPAPFCSMLLSDMGARVIRVDRPPVAAAAGLQDIADGPVNRGRESIAIDLRQQSGLELLRRLLRNADVLIEGFRPGVAEKLGFGPAICHEINPRLVFARMTGWGQTGPLARTAGHDINYIGLTGALHAMGEPDRCPMPPLNLLGDYGGGAMVMAYGIVCALFEAQRSGQGQVIDAAMVDGVALLMSPIYAMLGRGQWTTARHANLLDGSAPFYTTYRCRDGKFMAVGAIEPQFYEQFLGLLQVPGVDVKDQWRRDTWEATQNAFAQRFATRTRDEWAAHFDGSDACCTPVLDMSEAPLHPHNVERATFAKLAGSDLPNPAPRLSRTEQRMAVSFPRVGEHTRSILESDGLAPAEVDALIDSQTVFVPYAADASAPS